MPPWRAEVGTEPQWKQWFTDQMGALTGAHPRAVFIGDSILFAWPITGASSWNRFATYQPVDLGVPGDTTQNVLWRLDNGELTRLDPGAAVIMAGTNNLGTWSAADVAKGVEAVVDTVTHLLPRTRVILLGVLPIDPPGTVRHREVAAVDDALNARYAGSAVTFLDLRRDFAGPDGVLDAALYHPACVAGTDFCDQLVHPSDEGYSVMAAAVAPVLASLVP